MSVTAAQGFTAAGMACGIKESGDADLAFRRAVEPVYLALVDALLQASETAPTPELAQARLREAREVVESWKAAELRNYFHDACAAELDAQQQALDQIDPTAAVVYPIALEDRLELLVSRASGIARYPVPVSRTEFRAEVARFGKALKQIDSRRYLAPARQLYAWLVAPYLDDLSGDPSGNEIETLVSVRITVTSC